MKKKLVVGLIMGIIITGSAFAAYHDLYKCQPRLELMSILTRMKITDAQKHDVASILARHKTEFQPLIVSIKKARMDLRRAIRADSANKETILDAYRRLTSSGEKLVLLGAEVLGEVKGVLTPEQQQILKAEQENIDRAIECRIKSYRTFLYEWIDVHAHE